MDKSRTRKVRLRGVVVGALLLAVSPAWAQSLESDLRAAAQLQRPSLIKAMVVYAIANQQGSPEAVVSAAIQAAPAYRDQIAEAASSAYPGFAERIYAAAYGTPATRTAAAGSQPQAAKDAGAAGGSKEKKSPWSGEASAGGSKSTGNTETSSANANAKVIYEIGRWAHEGNALIEYASDDSDSTAQRWLVNYQPRYDISERLYGFGFAQYLDDRFSGYNYEVSENIGIGYRILLGKPVSLAVEAGPGGRHAEIARTGEKENEVTVRGAVKFAWQISQGAKFTNDIVVTAGQDRTITSNLAALTADLIDAWALRLSFEVRNNSNPPTGSEATDTTTLGHLVYAF